MKSCRYFSATIGYHSRHAVSRFVGIVVLPNPHAQPPRNGQQRVRLAIAFHVPFKLIAPIVLVGPGLSPVLRAPVPEAPVDEDCDSRATEDKIRRASLRRYRPGRNPVSEAKGVKSRTQGHFGAGVPAAVRLHDPAPGCAGLVSTPTSQLHYLARSQFGRLPCVDYAEPSAKPRRTSRRTIRSASDAGSLPRIRFSRSSGNVWGSRLFDASRQILSERFTLVATNFDGHLDWLTASDPRSRWQGAASLARRRGSRTTRMIARAAAPGAGLRAHVQWEGSASLLRSGSR